MKAIFLGPTGKQVGEIELPMIAGTPALITWHGGYYLFMGEEHPKTESHNQLYSQVDVGMVWYAEKSDASQGVE